MNHRIPRPSFVDLSLTYLRYIFSLRHLHVGGPYRIPCPSFVDLSLTYSRYIFSLRHLHVGGPYRIPRPSFVDLSLTYLRYILRHLHLQDSTPSTCWLYFQDIYMLGDHTGFHALQSYIFTLYFQFTTSTCWGTIQDSTP